MFRNYSEIDTDPVSSSPKKIVVNTTKLTASTPNANDPTTSTTDIVNYDHVDQNHFPSQLAQLSSDTVPISGHSSSRSRSSKALNPVGSSFLDPPNGDPPLETCDVVD